MPGLCRGGSGGGEAVVTQLIRYDAACRAIAAAKSVDEAKAIHDKAEALRVYYRQANNREMEANCAEIRIRAKRRAGELIIEQKQTVGLNRGTAGKGRPVKGGSAKAPPKDLRPTLREIGVKDKKFSTSAQALAKIAPKQFDVRLERLKKDMVTSPDRVSLDILRDQTQADKKTLRAERERNLGKNQRALPDKKYGVIVADPEWRFEPWSRESGMDRAADNHYPTSCTDVIAARDVPKVAADDCVLFLWATVPMLPHALVVMAAWGFDYRSHYVWVKDLMGTGYWNRNTHELLLIGTRTAVMSTVTGLPARSMRARRTLSSGRGARASAARRSAARNLPGAYHG